MLVESTQALNRTAISDFGATSQTPSLPSSSRSTPEKSAEQAPKGEEGASFSSVEAEDLLTLSVNAENEAAQSGERSQAAETAQAESQGGAGNLIESNLEALESREEERRQDLKENIDETLNEQLSLRFRQDKDTGTDIFQLVEPDTGDVVRQIPAEEVLEFIKKYQSSVSGLLLSEQA